MDAPDTTASRRPAKSEAAFRTISEVSEDLDVPQHVLRFWESKFAQIKPLKRGGGRRYYRPEDVVLLGHIRDLLYRDGYTIRGVQKLLREPGARSRMESGEPETPQIQTPEAAAEPPEEPSSGQDEVLRQVVGELLELRRLLADARRK
ncbi:MAG TPA: MerR family transcriptional regulator [Magnetospirillaceae bacterium]|nr:MerR family transcriptional regulator [Magnetospirillaceae bacterium]